jgi:hypothetical protein
MYDSEGTLELRIPDNKIVRALAILGFPMWGCRNLWSQQFPMILGNLSYTMFTGIFITKPLRGALITSKNFTTQD